MDDYREALRLAGITSHELVIGDDAPDAVVARHPGLMLLGGHDVDPALYGEPPHEKTEGVSASRDAYEMALVKAGSPATCRSSPFAAASSCSTSPSAAASSRTSRRRWCSASITIRAERRRCGHYVEGRPARTRRPRRSGARARRLLRRQQPAPSGAEEGRRRPEGDGDLGGRRHRGRRAPGVALLRRGAVASREFLAERPLPAPVRGFLAAASDALNDSGVDFNSGASLPARQHGQRFDVRRVREEIEALERHEREAGPSSTLRSRASVATSQDT